MQPLGDRRSGSPDRRRGAPYVAAEAREDLLVVKEGAVFLCARPDGDVAAGAPGGEGLYADDTRHLSELSLWLWDRRPVLLSSTDAAGYQAVIDQTNSELRSGDRVVVPQQTLALRRRMLIDERLYVAIELRNFSARPLETQLRLRLAADFLDMFEVRGAFWDGHEPPVVEAEETAGGVVLRRRGRDGRSRATDVGFEGPPPELRAGEGRVQAAWDIALAPADEAAVIVTVAPVTGSRRRRAVPHPSAARRVERSYRRFTAACTSLEGDGELFEKVIAASVRDLRALLTPIDEDGAAGGRILAAGIPWFVAPFGRDSLLASYEALPVNPDLARDTLLFLARRQAQEDDPWRDAEPGKVLHELRFGELTRTGLVPHSPYYGTVDATPLFVMLAGAYWRWTADAETITALKPALDAALGWMDEHGDRDGDGFLEYERRSRGGLLNQGWKDSEDSVVHADGTLAEGPIALVEVQGYAYLARQRIAEVYEALGEPDRARELRRQAVALKQAFNEAFWMPEEGTLALALDGRKRQVASVTSNPGHCLYCDVVDPAHQSAVAERLMAPDMFSGWGIRTLSRESPAYNPMSYHNGSIWPHDNAIAAAGLKRAGHDQAAARVAGAVFDVAAGARDFRLPELYCGFERGDEAAPVPYPVACNPQAWAAAAPFMLLQAMLGISARAAGGELDVHRPVLPPWLRHVRLRNMRVGSARVGLAFHRDERDAAGFSLIEQDGELHVTVTM